MSYIKKNWPLLLLLVASIVTSSIAFTVDSRVKTNYAYTPAQVANAINRTLNTSFQISEQRTGIVSYNVQITNSATLVLGNSGQILLEISPDNITWTTISTSTASMGSGVLVSAISTATVFGYVPRGYYVRIRSNNLTGTPTYGSPTGVEIQIN